VLVCVRVQVSCVSLVRLLLSATGFMVALPWGFRGAAVVPWGVVPCFRWRGCGRRRLLVASIHWFVRTRSSSLSGQMQGKPWQMLGAIAALGT
jgi:hypothetical protein